MTSTVSISGDPGWCHLSRQPRVGLSCLSHRCLPLVALLFLLIINNLVTLTDAGYPASVTGFYTDASAQQTILLDENISPREKKYIRNEILFLLGLRHKPRVRRRMDLSSAPQFMLQIYKALSPDSGAAAPSYDTPDPGIRQLNVTVPRLETNLDKADLIMSFVNQASIKQLYTDSGRRLYFDFSEVPPTDGVTGAEFRIYKYSSPWLHERGPFTIRLFKITNDKNRLETVLKLETDLSVSATEEGWLQMDVTKAIEHWRHQRTDEIVLYMEIIDSQGTDLDPSAIGLVDSAGPEDKQAFLVTCFKANHRLHVRKSRSLRGQRHRRSPAPTSYYSDEKDYRWRYPSDRPSRRACQRRQLYVSFRALGWESWVIAPEGYPAFYCDGECMFPLNVHMNATNHAIVQALVHLVKPFLAPNPYCAPTTLDALSFLYLDNSYNVVLKNYKNMVVQACGCH